jgi:hypothetical protein
MVLVLLIVLCFTVQYLPVKSLAELLLYFMTVGTDDRNEN